MPLESATFLSGLVSSNPASTDQVSLGDDHIRLIKAVLLSTFPNADRAFRLPDVIAEKSSSYSVAIADDNSIIPFNATSAAITVTLPVGSTLETGFSTEIVKSDASTNSVTITRSSSDTIEGQSSLVLHSRYSSVKLVWAGGNVGWMIPHDIKEEIGFIKIWPFATVPSGRYLFLDGSTISRTTYARLNALFSSYTYPYGNGDGITTFKIPDLRGRFVRCYDATATVDVDAVSRTDRGDGTGGNVVGAKQEDANVSHTHTITMASVANHTHTHIISTNNGASANMRGVIVDGDGLGTTITSSASGGHTPTGTNSSTGGNEARPKNLTSLYVMRAL